MLRQLVDGIDFYDTIVNLGEEITFLTDPPVNQFASIKPHRTTNTTDGAYWYTGAMTFDSVDQQNELLGEYFTRQTNSGPMNILVSVLPENTTPKLGRVYSVECNEKIDIVSYYEGTGQYNEFGEEEFIPVYLAQDVDCYMTMVRERTDKEAPGYFVDTLTNLLLPAKFTLSPENVILKYSFVFDRLRKKNVVEKIRYKVESVDTSRWDIVNGKNVGTLLCLLTEDRR